MEIIDIVDEQDNAIGTIEKEESHKNGALHRLVVVFVFASDGRLYVQKRTDDGLLDHSIGGHVDHNESYANATKREAAEEFGIRLPLERLNIFISDERSLGKPYQHMIALCECTVPSDWTFSPTKEVEEVLLMSVEDIVSHMNAQPHLFTGGFLHTMREYIRLKQLPFTVTVG